MGRELSTWFVSGKAAKSPEWMADYIHAGSFAEAHEMALQLGRRKFCGQEWMLTAVALQPEIATTGPVAIALEIAGGRGR